MTRPDWPTALADYGRHLHALAGHRHHVVSPLGAWMVLAVCGGLAKEDAEARSQLAEALRSEPVDAASFTGLLLSQPHPLVAAGAGLWVRSDMDNARVRRWRAGLPEQVDTGAIPSQEKLDQWAFDRTLGLIKRFPLTITPDSVCLLASALATKVSWEVPFQIVDAAELGASRWDRSVARVLRTPNDPRHRQFLTDTADVGPVAVHLATARGGLLVGSVLAADPAAPADRILAVAERVVTAEAQQPGQVERLSLFDLPLGPGPVWDIHEQESDGGAGPFNAAERFTTIMPAWSANTDLDLTGQPQLGFGAAAGAIARALELSHWQYSARQSAVAKYSAVGFEAAAVTALGIALSARVPPPITRQAVIRFRHPYAVVAATYNDSREPSPAVWGGLPVFSAWVAKAENADMPDR
ncbi:MAG: hypothetical protein J2P57_08845 [Acidimicrobiaceae bacterium]|nr:hypothetical protein [Acidimicrobiaceae bacterium]